MIGFYDGKEYLQFDDLESFFIHVVRKRYRSYKIYAHFGGKYDFSFLLEHIRTTDHWKDRLKYSLITQGAKILEIKLGDHHRNTWRLVDSSALFPGLSLDKLSKCFKTTDQKLTGTINFSAGERVDRNNPSHRDYLRHDCYSLFQVVQGFISQPYIEKTGLSLTIASQAMNTWRETLKHTVKVNPQFISNFIRQGYFGGRVEIFKFKGENLNYYDVNSLFPFCMRKNPVPLEFKGEVTEVTDDLGFYDVSVTSPELYIPLLPVRSGLKLLFPNGSFRGVFYSEELKLALERGYRITCFHRGYNFYRSYDFFSDYIDNFYEIKKNAEKGTAGELIAKLLLNSLYGKFGQRETRSKIKTRETETNFRMFHSEEIYNKTNLIQIEESHRAAYMLPQIAAAITSMARVHMARLCFLHNECSRYYTDTDSILTTEKFNTGKEIGELKLENGGLTGAFLRPKGYELLQDGKVIERKMKGFPTKFIKNLSSKDFNSLNFSYKDNVFATFRRSLISNGCFLSKIAINKTIKSPYSKRRILSQGETEPWILKGGEIINAC